MPVDDAQAAATLAPGAFVRVGPVQSSADHDGLPPISRSLTRQAVVDTFASRGARVGIAWLVLLAAFAVFSPFIASSHPLLMKMNGEWSSPVLRHLTPADALFLIATAVTILLAITRRYNFGRSLLTLLGAVALAAPFAFWLVRPPENVDYAQYRAWAAAGKIEHSILAPVPFSPRDRLRDQPDARLTPPWWQIPLSRALHDLMPKFFDEPAQSDVEQVAKITPRHFLGTDTNGADVLSNVLHASRIALSIGFIATGISVVLGILIGGVMGYYAGPVDLLGMRLIEIFEAIPRLMLLIIVNAFVSHRNIYLMMAVIGFTGWTSYARYLRAEFLTLRHRDFVQAAIAAGLPRRLILFRHMLANGLTPILVTTTFGVASAILYESVLSFLGLGLVDEPSWGALLNQARAGGAGFVWWIALFPGLAIFLTVFSYNLVGEAVRDALDPKLRKRE